MFIKLASQIVFVVVQTFINSTLVLIFCVMFLLLLYVLQVLIILYRAIVLHAGLFDVIVALVMSASVMWIWLRLGKQAPKVK